MVLALFLFPLVGKPGQFWGGELSYRLLNRQGTSYSYEIRFRIYRDCSSDAELDDPIIRILNTTDITRNTHPLTYREVTLTDRIVVPMSYSKKGYCAVNDPPDCAYMVLFVTQIELPYSVEGYTMYYTGCCRNGLGNLQLESWNAGTEMIYGVPEPGQSLTLYCKIPSHDIIQDNSSPISLTDSVIYSCLDRPLNYSFQFTDPDGDSLSFRFCGSIGKTPTATTSFFPINYRAGFGLNSPLKGSPTVALDPVTGEISGIPDAEGAFAIVICVEEFRNGTLINTHRKEFQVNVRDCEIKKPDDIIRCGDLKVLFEHDNNPNNIYSWDFGVTGSSTDISNAYDPVYTYPAAGDYNVKLILINPDGCADSIFSQVKLYPGLAPDFSWTMPLCHGVPITLTDQSSTATGSITSRTWRVINKNTVIGTGQTVNFTQLVQGNFHYPLSVQLTIVNGMGCRDSILKVIEIHPEVIANAGPDKILSFNQTYILPGNNSVGGSLYQWTPAQGLDDPSKPNPVLNYDHDNTYVLRVFNEGGCMDSDTVSIRYMKGPEIYVPNAFTPNQDGVNDILNFFPVSYDIESISIFNRWGQLVFYAKDHLKGWDGKVKGVVQESGVYIWMIKGKDYVGVPFLQKGSVMLLK